MYLINEKVLYYNRRALDEDSINCLNSYAEICVQICRNQKMSTPEFEVAL